MKVKKFSFYFFCISLILILEISLFHFFDSGKNESRLLFAYFGIFNFRHYKAPFDWMAYRQMLWVVGICLFIGLALDGRAKFFSLMMALGTLGNVLQLHFFGYVGDWIGFRISSEYTKVANLSDALIFFGGICFLICIFWRVIYFFYRKLRDLLFWLRERHTV